MTAIRRRTTLATAIVTALLATAACSGRDRAAATPDEALLKDLQQAGGTAAEVEARSGKTQVVSAIELGSSTKAAPEPRVVRRAATPSKQPSYAAAPAAAKEEPAPAVEPTKAPEPAPSVQPTPDPTPAPAADSRRPEASMPLPLPTPTPRPRGGYKSVGEVIRNAPFPINP